MNARYAPPKSAVVVESTMDWDGQYLLMRTNGVLPAYCLRCGSDHELRTRKLKLRYLNPLWYVFVLSPVILLIVSLIFTKKGVVTVSECEPCAANYRRWKWIAWTALAVMIAAFAGAFGTDAAHGDSSFVLFVLAGVALLVGGIAGSLAQPRLLVRKFKDGVFHVNRLKKAFKQRL